MRQSSIIGCWVGRWDGGCRVGTVELGTEEREVKREGEREKLIFTLQE